jgi:hypothetical protein
MKELFSKLTPAEIERLALLGEEMGEAHQIIGKILRHGYHSCHPNGGPTNRRLLEKELGDVRAAIALMLTAGDVGRIELWLHEQAKVVKVQKYLHHQRKEKSNG